MLTIVIMISFCLHLNAKESDLANVSQSAWDRAVPRAQLCPLQHTALPLAAPDTLAQEHQLALSQTQVQWETQAGCLYLISPLANCEFLIFQHFVPHFP